MTTLFRVVRAEGVPWQAFPAFPSAARIAILVGDPSQPGPYLIRCDCPATSK